MEDEFDYRKDLADIEEFCDYTDEVLNELDIDQLNLHYRDEHCAVFINGIGDTRCISANQINSIFINLI